MLALAAYMPMFGLTLAAVIPVEWVLLRRLPTTRRWLGLERGGLVANGGAVLIEA